MRLVVKRVSNAFCLRPTVVRSKVRYWIASLTCSDAVRMGSRLNIVHFTQGFLQSRWVRSNPADALHHGCVINSAKQRLPRDQYLVATDITVNPGSDPQSPIESSILDRFAHMFASDVIAPLQVGDRA